MKKWQWTVKGAAVLTVFAGLLTTAAPAQAKTVGSGDSITLWSWAGGPQLDAVKKIATAWAKVHGATVTVVDESQNPKSFAFYGTAARTGKGPDVVFGIPHDNLGTFQQEGLLAAAPKDAYNPANYTQSTVDAVKVNGTSYAIPVTVESIALFYNTSKIKSAPVGWSVFAKDASKYGFAFDQGNLYFNYGFIGGYGGYIFKNTNGKLDPTNIGLANAGAIKAYQLLHNFDSTYKWMTPSMTGAIAKTQFTTGKIGMYISGAWDIADIQKAKVPYAIAPLPVLPNGKRATPFLGVKTTFVNSRSRTQDADWSLAEALSTKDAQQSYFTSAQQIPAFVSLQKSGSVHSNPYFKAFTDQIQFAVPMPNIPQMNAVWTAASVIANIIKGSVTPEQGAKDFLNNVKKGIEVQG